MKIAADKQRAINRFVRKNKSRLWDKNGMCYGGIAVGQRKILWFVKTSKGVIWYWRHHAYRRAAEKHYPS